MTYKVIYNPFKIWKQIYAVIEYFKRCMILNALQETIDIIYNEFLFEVQCVESHLYCCLIHGDAGQHTASRQNWRKGSVDEYIFYYMAV